MGKSSAKRKKGALASGEGNVKLDPDDAVFLKRAHELKDEGNSRFQSKDYTGALDIYDQALKLTPEGHPDRAVFHSNRAACLLQLKPVQYESVVSECSQALDAHPKFGKALFRRARAYEAMGKLQLALTDVQFLLQSESNNQDAQDLEKRLRATLQNVGEPQPDTQCPSSTFVSACPPHTSTSPATPGAEDASSCGGRGPSLPARPVLKKKGRSTFESDVSRHVSVDNVSYVPLENDHSLSSDSTKSALQKDQQCKVCGNLDDEMKSTKREHRDQGTKTIMRPLKLIYGQDIRRAELPINSGYGHLREVVRKRFPSLKAVLIKFHDLEGDLVTITSREDVRLAELATVEEASKNKTRSTTDTVADSLLECSMCHIKSSMPGNNSPELLRLHIVEVNAEQEPPIPDNDDISSISEEDKVEDADLLREEVTQDSVGGLHDKSTVTCESGQSSTVKHAKREDGQPAGEEMEIDDWLFDFAQLFRTHVGIDPEGHVDFHELGMELCSEALETVVTSEEAQPLFDAAASKFQEVAALALFNWGNVYICAARKHMPLEEAGSKAAGSKTESKTQLQAAFDWAQSRYKLAGEKYEEALKIKPDFYEGVLALGQEKFESAKLQWAAIVASGVDLKSWDSSETLDLYRFAEEKMQTAAEMWEQLEQQQQLAAEGCSRVRKDHAKLDLINEDSAAEAVDHGAAMRCQINLFWGNVLFEHSQVEFRLGLPSWKGILDAAMEKFASAGASKEEIEGALNNHLANVAKESADTAIENENKSEISLSEKKVDCNGSAKDGNVPESSQKNKNSKHEKLPITGPKGQNSRGLAGDNERAIVAERIEKAISESNLETGKVLTVDNKSNTQMNKLGSESGTDNDGKTDKDNLGPSYQSKIEVNWSKIVSAKEQRQVLVQDQKSNYADK